MSRYSLGNTGIGDEGGKQLIRMSNSDGRCLVDHELRELMTELDVKIVCQAALEERPGVSPRIISDKHFLGTDVFPTPRRNLNARQTNQHFEKDMSVLRRDTEGESEAVWEEVQVQQLWVGLGIRQGDGSVDARAAGGGAGKATGISS